MSAKRTPFLSIINKKLAALNDQFCFYLFLEQEFEQQLSDFSPVVSRLYTSDVFANNLYAPKIHIKLEKIPEFQERSKSFTFGAYFSTSYEIVSDYLDNSSLNLLQQIIPTSYNLVRDGQIERQFFNTLQASGCNLPAQELIQTLTYIRLRRNYFIHLDDAILNRLSQYIATYGTVLNTYWASTITKLDFTNLDIHEFSTNETIDLLKLLRIITEILDQTIASSLSTENVLLHLAEQFKPTSRQKLNSEIIQQLAQRLKKKAELDYGLESTIEQAQQAIAGITP